MISQHTDSTAPLQIAAEKGVLGFGQASNMIQFAPDHQLTAIIDDWAPYYVARTKAVLDGSWASVDTWDGLKQGMVGMADWTNMPADVAAAATDMRDKIASGAFHPFQGPIIRQDGSQAIGEGEVLDDGTLLGMNWYVLGVDDELPQ